MKHNAEKKLLPYLLYAILLLSCSNKTENQSDSTTVNKEDHQINIQQLLGISHSNPFGGEWLLISDLFDTLLTFKRIEASDSSMIYGKQFNFYKDSLEFEDFNPVPICGNGLFYMDSCSYAIKDNFLILHFIGGYHLDSRFDYCAKFRLINSAEDWITIKRTDIIKNEHKSFFEELNGDV